MSKQRFPQCEFYEDRKGIKPATVGGPVGMARAGNAVAFVALNDDERPIWVGDDTLELDDVNDALHQVK